MATHVRMEQALPRYGLPKVVETVRPDHEGNRPRYLAFFNVLDVIEPVILYNFDRDG